MVKNLNAEDIRDAGVIPRSIKTIFDCIQNDQVHTYAGTMSYVQIYLDTLQDLLQPTNKKISIRENANNGVFVSNVCTIDIYSLADFLQVLDVGNSNRVSAFTNLNAPYIANSPGRRPKAL